MNNLIRKLFSILFLIIFFSLLTNFFRQVLVYHRINRHLLEEKEELQALEKRNQGLKQKLEEVKKQEFFRLLSPTQTPQTANSGEAGRPKFKRWWGLFFY